MWSFLIAPVWYSCSPLLWGLSSFCNAGKLITHYFLKYIVFSFSLSLGDISLCRCEHFYFHPPFCWALFYIFFAFFLSRSLQGDFFPPVFHLANYSLALSILPLVSSTVVVFYTVIVLISTLPLYFYESLILLYDVYIFYYLIKCIYNLILSSLFIFFHNSALDSIWYSICRLCFAVVLLLSYLILWVCELMALWGQQLVCGVRWNGKEMKVRLWGLCPARSSPARALRNTPDVQLLCQPTLRKSTAGSRQALHVAIHRLWELRQWWQVTGKWIPQSPHLASFVRWPSQGSGAVWFPFLCEEEAMIVPRQ